MFGVILSTALALAGAQTCDVMSHGAKGDGVAEDTAAITAAIAACSRGGIVLLPYGHTFLSMPFNLTSNIVLAVEGTLIAPAKPDLSRWTTLPHFPSYQLSRSGHWTRFAPLVGAYNVSNVTIAGGGVIDGRGRWWWANYNKLQSERPRLVEPEWVQGLVVRNITLKHSPYWTLHPIYCNDVHISDIVITAGYNTSASDVDTEKLQIEVPPYNTDGIDPDSCSNVLIENYYYCGGDDAVAIKSGWNWAGIQFGMPSKNILVRNATSGCRGGFTIGSEMSGGVENVTFLDSFSTGQCGFRISSELGRGGYVRNVRFENIHLSWKHPPPPPTGPTPVPSKPTPAPTPAPGPAPQPNSSWYVEAQAGACYGANESRRFHLYGKTSSFGECQRACGASPLCQIYEWSQKSSACWWRLDGVWKPVLHQGPRWSGCLVASVKGCGPADPADGIADPTAASARVPISSSHLPPRKRQEKQWSSKTNPHAPFLFLVDQGYRPDNPNKTLPVFSNISFVNITAEGAATTQMGDFFCLTDSPCHGFNIDGLRLSGFDKSPLTCHNVFGKTTRVTGGSVCIAPE
jgi:hypothetical protein